MTQTLRDAVKKFEDTIGISFQLYNSLFLSLPFFDIEKTGTLLTLFNQACETGFDNERSPTEIIEDFFSASTSIEAEKEKIDLLFRFVQYAERQVVLFDALEDASFDKLHNLEGPGSVSHLLTAVSQKDKRKDLAKRLEEFSIRLVLTAHPTQFYPGWVLGIINDLSKAIDSNDAAQVKLLLQQLGRTPFFKKKKPTPIDEASSLIWYLQNVFYHAIGKITTEIKNAFPDERINLSNIIKMGFWSGGDRDGNPFVKVDTTLHVAAELRRAILRCYYDEVHLLQRRLTFSGVEKPLGELERELYENAFKDDMEKPLTRETLLKALEDIRETLVSKHDGLFLHMLDDLIHKVELFGLHIASLDIRQDSSIHKIIYEQIAENTSVLPEHFLSLSNDEKIDAILKVEDEIDLDSFDDELTKDTFRSVDAIRKIQQANGESGCNRYIISNSKGGLNVIEVFGFFLMRGWKREELTVDIIPLFETVDDLQNAGESMRKLYENEVYREHLSLRGNSQTIMLGFSDGTKDGGYLMANYGIYRAKDELTKVSREFGIDVIFFDGRGGPPCSRRWKNP